MYHFIRRFFLFVLVFACCFVFTRSGHPQNPFGDYGLMTYPSISDAYWNSTYGLGNKGWGFPASSGMGYVGSGLLSYLNIEQQPFGRGLPSGTSLFTPAHMYTQPIGQSQIGNWYSPVYSGTSAVFFELASTQQDIPNIVSQRYLPGEEMGGKGFLTSIARNESPVSSVNNIIPASYLYGRPSVTIPMALAWTPRADEDSPMFYTGHSMFSDPNRKFYQSPLPPPLPLYRQR